jgi:hypothetical protein
LNRNFCMADIFIPSLELLVDSCNILRQ